MTIDPNTALALGFPKQKYMAIERERRWLCREVPRDQILSTAATTDLYVAGTRLRLREARPDQGPPIFKLSRKVDVDAHTRLITTIYLPENEFVALSSSLHGTVLKKRRHRLSAISGIHVVVDEFEGKLGGLILAEAEFETAEQLSAFPTPGFALREVTDDARFTGSELAMNGLPDDLPVA
ncbi:MAG: hypothetical protein JOZ55_05255 [Alphaproteobacteria bacterium]|nr:hypothetical protein [Alphaproteobacteria bacterium]